MRNLRNGGATIALLVSLSFVSTFAQSAGAPVIVNGVTLFELRERSGQFTPTERAAIIRQRIDHLAHNPFRQQSEITVIDTNEGSDAFARAHARLVAGVVAPRTPCRVVAVAVVLFAAGV
jgi:hypothetical protein